MKVKLETMESLSGSIADVIVEAWERGYQSGVEASAKPEGCICPGDATPFCQNPQCSRKAKP